MRACKETGDLGENEPAAQYPLGGGWRKERQYNRYSDLDSGLSEGKSKNPQPSALLHATWFQNAGSVQAEGGSRCVALGQQAPGLQTIHDRKSPDVPA